MYIFTSNPKSTVPHDYSYNTNCKAKISNSTHLLYFFGWEFERVFFSVLDTGTRQDSTVSGSNAESQNRRTHDPSRSVAGFENIARAVPRTRNRQHSGGKPRAPVVGRAVLVVDDAAAATDSRVRVIKNPFDFSVRYAHTHTHTRTRYDYLRVRFTYTQPIIIVVVIRFVTSVESRRRVIDPICRRRSPVVFLHCFFLFRFFVHSRVPAGG